MLHKKEYNGGRLIIKVAYTEKVALQSYADSGDNIEICLDQKSDNALMYMTYSNNLGLTGMYYRYGTWYDFREKEPGNSYEGCYINDPFGKDEGIVMKYSNGNETKTNYFPFDSKKDVINELIARKNAE